jgi:TIR domain-containing protein
MPEPPRIFLSYARSDGKAFAATLRRQLESHDFSLFQDIANLEGGQDWWQHIDKALHTVEFMVLVLTPAAIKSTYVEKEWRLARQEGVCVVPGDAGDRIYYLEIIDDK